MHISKLLVFFMGLNIVQILSLIIQPKGPNFRKYASKCVERIANDAFDVLTKKFLNYSKLLVSFPVDSQADTPTYELQNVILKQFSKQKWWTIQTIQASESLQPNVNFQSYSEGCNTRHQSMYNGSCTKRFVEKIKTNFYVIIVDDAADFVSKYSPAISASQSYDYKALAMVLVTKVPSNMNREAKKIVDRLTKGIVLIPKNVTTFIVYKLNYDHREGIPCYANIILEVNPWRECIKGSFKIASGNVFKEAESKQFKNCIMYAQARKYPPYVIDKNNGVEIDILKLVGEALDITFIIDLHPNVQNHLGEPLFMGDQLRSFVGFLGEVYNINNLSLAIGNLHPDLNYTQYFTYSVTYHSERLVWVLPKANLIPSWRVLTVIFNLEMWGVCLAIIFGFGILFFIASRFNKEVVCFKTLEKCVMASYEIIMAAPVPIQPISDYTRMFFISAAFLAIIINSVYTTSLIQFLTAPVREHQITHILDWLADPQRFVGGPAAYKTLPKAGTPARELFNHKYKTVNDTLDWYIYWLNLVANQRNVASIIGRLPMRYLEAINDPLITYRSGELKIYMPSNDLLVKSVSIMMIRGHPLKDDLDGVLQRAVIEGGLLERFIDRYLRKAFAGKGTNSSKTDGEDEEQNSYHRPLTTHHLQGAFAFLFLGQIAGTIMMILEIIFYQIKKAYYRYTIRKGHLFEFVN